jgi:hypothetical protein
MLFCPPFFLAISIDRYAFRKAVFLAHGDRHSPFPLCKSWHIPSRFFQRFLQFSGPFQVAQRSIKSRFQPQTWYMPVGFKEKSVSRQNPPFRS